MKTTRAARVTSLFRAMYLLRWSTVTLLTCLYQECHGLTFKMSQLDSVTTEVITVIISNNK